MRKHYGHISTQEPLSEASMRNFVFEKIGPTLPERSLWQ
ncbi:hypothetical protein BLL52_4239 [Rhodoferax antarcticus ANT.BR]|uniref:Uncharacterized protein n=1 Tax=Rhodoferax antarcticus ANT.BR TaxID=1111071 RepID=A0A1Q8Y8Y5_9BURK|nr:hypothetical protein BLL52_4239 [Rhodoferax antarcticus ANT.BR]